MATVPKVVSYEEWLEMPEVEDAIEEVVNGEIRIMPPNKWKHSRIIYKLQHMLERGLNPDAAWVITSEFGLVIRKAPLTCRVPDLAVFVPQNIVEEDGYIHSAPELVVEVLSPRNTRREMAVKIQDYESIGVPELWILSPEARTIEVLRLQEGKLRTVQVLVEGQLCPARFPEAVVEVASIWPD